MKPKVFLGSSGESLELALDLQLQLLEVADVHIWKDAFQPGSFTLEQLLVLTKEVDFGVFVFSADDMTEIRGQRVLTARDNVVLELGLFLGAIGRERSLIVVEKVKPSLHLPTDLQGLVHLEFSVANEETPRNELTSHEIRASTLAAGSQLRNLIKKRGPRQSEVTSLSGGPIYLLRHLAGCPRSMPALTKILFAFQKRTLQAPAHVPRGVWSKAAKYACQSLLALGLVEPFGGDEYRITSRGEQLLKSDSFRNLHPKTFSLPLVAVYGRDGVG